MVRCARAALLVAALVRVNAAGGDDGLLDVERLQGMFSQPRESGWAARQARREQTLKKRREVEEMVGARVPARQGQSNTNLAVLPELSVEKAQALAEALIVALRKKNAQNVMAKILRNSGEASGHAETRQALTPALEKFARPVLKRFGFAASFRDAVALATAAMRDANNRSLAAVLEELDEIASGQLSLSREGRVAELDRLARGFLDMPTCERRAALEEAEEALGRLGSAAHPASEQYLQAMSSVLESGHDDFIADRAAHLGHRLKDSSELGEEGARSLQAQLNVLSQFLRLNGHTAFQSHDEL